MFLPKLNYISEIATATNLLPFMVVGVQGVGHRSDYFSFSLTFSQKKDENQENY